MGQFKKLRQAENRIRYSYLSQKIEDQLPLKAVKEIKAIQKRSKNPKREYFKQVRGLTKQVDKTQIEGYNKDLLYNHRNDGLMVKALNRLVIDHKIPLFYGYKNSIEPEKIADISNLQYITVKENMKKGINPLIDDSNRWIIE